MSALRGENSLYLFLSAYVSGLLLSKAGLFFLMAALLFWLLARSSLPARSWARSLALWSLAIAVGGLRMEVRNPCRDPKHYLRQPASEYWLVACRSQSEDRPKTQRVKAEILAVLRHVPAADTLTAAEIREEVPFCSVGNLDGDGMAGARDAQGKIPLFSGGNVKADREPANGRGWQAVPFACGTAVRDSFVWQECRGLVQLYFPKADTSVRGWQYGDRIWLRGRLEPIEGFTGSDGTYFDYGAFMARKRVYGRMFLREGDYGAMPAGGLGLSERLYRMAFSLREKVAAFMDCSPLQGSNLAVAKSLVLGLQGSDPVEEAYRDAGIVHVLAVSGMHLSIFAYIVLGLFRFLGHKTWQRWLRFLLVLGPVWGYSLLTGLCPSVARAACMFTFVGLGQCLGKRTSLMRSLAVSALILLWVNPDMLYDLGFLLSYLAVAGLALVNPWLVKIWSPRRRLPRLFWEMSVTSVSAQVMTFPVVLSVFGTFPTYFLIANWIAVPLGNAALPMGIVVSLVSLFWEGLAFYLAYPLEWTVALMNASAAWIARWPMAVGNFSMSLLSVLLFYAFFAYALRTLARPKASNLEYALVCFWLMLIVG